MASGVFWGVCELSMILGNLSANGWLCSCLASCLAWGVQNWSLLVIEWNWVIVLRLPIDITWGWEVSGGPMFWTQLSHLRGSGLTPGWSTKTPSATRLLVLVGLLQRWAVALAHRGVKDTDSRSFGKYSLAWALPESKHAFFFFFLVVDFLIYLFIYLFIIYGCVESSFLCEGFLQLRQAGATLHRSARASHYHGLSCCGAQAPDVQAQQLWLTGLVAPRHVGSSQTRARTRVPCIGRQTLNHWATREAPSMHSYTLLVDV